MHNLQNPLKSTIRDYYTRMSKILWSLGSFEIWLIPISFADSGSRKKVWNLGFGISPEFSDLSGFSPLDFFLYLIQSIIKCFAFLTRIRKLFWTQPLLNNKILFYFFKKEKKIQCRTYKFQRNLNPHVT